MKDTPRRKQVIINGDDLGFSPGVTEGILRSHRRGVLTSTTILANMPGAEQAARMTADCPRLGVGVHLNVTQGPALSKEGRVLADGDGVMRRTPLEVVRACIPGRRMLAAVKAECDAQIRWVLDHDIRPTHLDSHRHLHVFPSIFVRVADLAARYGIRFVRWPREKLPGADWPAAPAGQRRLRAWLNLFSRLDHALCPRLHGAAGTWGIAHTGHIDSDWLIRAAGRVGPGVIEIMTHPGLEEGLDPRLTRLVESRSRELEALCDPAVAEAFRGNSVRLINYGELP
jgi:predicted glycoside hydrolase/deacetylase ChbG (UPF0249 family)